MCGQNLISQSISWCFFSYMWLYILLRQTDKAQKIVVCHKTTNINEQSYWKQTFWLVCVMLCTFCALHKPNFWSTHTYVTSRPIIVSCFIIFISSASYVPFSHPQHHPSGHSTKVGNFIQVVELEEIEKKKKKQWEQRWRNQ